MRERLYRSALRFLRFDGILLEFVVFKVFSLRLRNLRFFKHKLLFIEFCLDFDLFVAVFLGKFCVPLAAHATSAKIHKAIIAIFAAFGGQSRRNRSVYQDLLLISADYSSFMGLPMALYPGVFAVFGDFARTSFETYREFCGMRGSFAKSPVSARVSRAFRRDFRTFAVFRSVVGAGFFDFFDFSQQAQLFAGKSRVFQLFVLSAFSLQDNY